MSAFPSYELKLHKTYYEKGFFNLGVSVDKYIRHGNGKIELYFGANREKLLGKVNRDANLNGTPRIMVGSELRDLFFKNYQLGDTVKVTIESPTKISVL